MQAERLHGTNKVGSREHEVEEEYVGEEYVERQHHAICFSRTLRMICVTESRTSKPSSQAHPMFEQT